jgi:hypothetical protein|nr:MAG TPA: hypothetical protein [Caudoviricetes sp.]
MEEIILSIIISLLTTRLYVKAFIKQVEKRDKEFLENIEDIVIEIVKNKL